VFVITLPFFSPSMFKELFLLIRRNGSAKVRGIFFLPTNNFENILKVFLL